MEMDRGFYIKNFRALYISLKRKTIETNRTRLCYKLYVLF